LIATPSGVGQPRRAWTMERRDVSVVTVACQPSATTISPTARPSK
jgi:hypothetical protein